MLNESSLINVDVLFDNKIVLYGAGYYGQRMFRILKYMGIPIKYFCDSEQKKWGYNIYGVEVISPENLKKFDDMENIAIIITVDFNNSCAVNQIKNIIENLQLKTSLIFTVDNLESALLANIHYARINTSKSENMGCSSLYSYMLVDSDGISVCCKLNDFQNPPPKILWKNNDWNYEKTVFEYIKMRNRLINSIKNNKICECTFCGEIKDNVNFNKICNISFAFSYPCNMHCIYCGLHKEKTDAFAGNFNFSHFISICEKQGSFSENLMIGLASGEITISSRVGDMFDIARKYKLSAITNGSVYNEILAELTVTTKYDGTEWGWGGIMISVDAGTRETFKRIKGIDAFDKVWKNIKKYQNFGSRVLLKYVFLEENSNDTDVEKFIENVVNVEVTNVVIDRDAFRSQFYSQEQKYLMVKMYKFAKLNGINVFFGGCFNEYERNELMQLITQG